MASWPGKAGDIIRFERENPLKNYWHFAVQVDEENVIHLTGDFHYAKKEGVSMLVATDVFVKRESYRSVVRGSKKVGVYNRYDGKYNPLPVDKIVERAESKLGPAKYDVLRENCEHFANWCRYDKDRSEQVEAVVDGVATIASDSVGVAVGVVASVVVAAGVRPILIHWFDFWRAKYYDRRK